jgi:hypothetical protein
MSEMDLLTRLHASISRVTGDGTGRRYPKRLQRRVVEYYRLRSSQGLSDAEIAAEVGIPWKTIQRWCEQSPASTPETDSSAFEPVQIVETVASPLPASRSTLVVRGPAGLCIEGLDLDSLAELVRRLS